MGLGDNTTINKFWKTAIIVKIATVAAGMAVLAFDPSYYIIDTWQIHVEEIQLRRVYALVQQFVITSTATFVMYLILSIFCKPFPGMEKERMRLITYFFGCGCFIDVVSLLCTLYIYKSNDMRLSGSVMLSMVLDVVWFFMKGMFVLTHWQAAPAVEASVVDKKKE